MRVCPDCQRQIDACACDDVKLKPYERTEDAGVVECVACNGSGLREGLDALHAVACGEGEECPECQGTGMVEV